MTTLEKMQEIQMRFVGSDNVSCTVTNIITDEVKHIAMYVYYWYDGGIIDSGFNISGAETYRLDMILKHGLPKMVRP